MSELCPSTSCCGKVPSLRSFLARLVQKGTEGMPELPGLGRRVKKASPSYPCLPYLIIRGEGRAEPAERVRPTKTRRALFPKSERTEAPLALCAERVGRKSKRRCQPASPPRRTQAGGFSCSASPGPPDLKSSLPPPRGSCPGGTGAHLSLHMAREMPSSGSLCHLVLSAVREQSLG